MPDQPDDLAILRAALEAGPCAWLHEMNAEDGRHEKAATLGEDDPWQDEPCDVAVMSLPLYAIDPARIARLVARLEAAEKDAQRYRWLMSNCGFESEGRVTELRLVFEKRYRPDRFTDLQPAIDAAMKESSQ